MDSRELQEAGTNFQVYAEQNKRDNKGLSYRSGLLNTNSRLANYSENKDITRINR